MLFRTNLVPVFEKLLLRTVFENTKNTILIFSENCSYSSNLVFYVFSLKTLFWKTIKKSNLLLIKEAAINSYLFFLTFIHFVLRRCSILFL